MQVAKTKSDVQLRLTTADRVLQEIAYQAPHHTTISEITGVAPPYISAPWF
jgi:hypothetical protein